MKEPEDYFDTVEFKSLPLGKRLWRRAVIAFWLTISL